MISGPAGDCAPETDWPREIDAEDLIEVFESCDFGPENTQAHICIAWGSKRKDSGTGFCKHSLKEVIRWMSRKWIFGRYAGVM